jgi:hypothetical protein
VPANPPSFEVVRVPKPAPVQWRARTVRLADMDGDDDLDLIGMLTHVDGELPGDRPSVFLLLNEGDPLVADGWRLLPVKWGPGRTMELPAFGEKWDQADVTDVDGDGDLDIVANCEEWWVTDQGEVASFFTPELETSSVGVVWFENRLQEALPVVEEDDSRIDLEAERPSVVHDSTWVERAPVRGDRSAAGTAAFQAHNGQPVETRSLPAAPGTGVSYAVEAAGGDCQVWARLFAPARFGVDLGGNRSDSAWLVADDGDPLLLGDDGSAPGDRWRWVRAAEPLALDAGRHDLSLQVREHGVAVDRIVLTTDRSFRPT